MITPVKVLFCEEKTIYSKLGCDTYNKERNALTCKSAEPCIYHPPCRTWGRLRKLCGNYPGEHLLAVWSIFRIWRYGGVLEHPAGSKLWKLLNLPLPGSGVDSRGGFSLSIDQHWFGHPCKKNTWLYIKGINQSEIPEYEIPFTYVTHCISSTNKSIGMKEVSKNWRNRTPEKLASFMIQIILTIKNKETKK